MNVEVVQKIVKENFENYPLRCLKIWWWSLVSKNKIEVFVQSIEEGRTFRASYNLADDAPYYNK